jgi:hypothetical protein
MLHKTNQKRITWHDHCVNKIKRQCPDATRKEDAMKIMMKILAVVAVWATPALASKDAETMGGSPLVLIFLGFGALIVVFQMIPSLLFFVSMLKGFFVGAENHPLQKSGSRIP